MIRRVLSQYMYHEDMLIEYAESMWYPNGYDVDNREYMMSTYVDRPLPCISAAAGVQGQCCAYAK